MTGPPTPPPTSQTEIEDAARISAPAQPIPEPTDVPPAQPVAPYQTAVASIQQSSANGNYAELIRIAEEEDMLTLDHGNKARLFVIAPLTLAYLIADDPAAARYVITRLPKNLASTPLASSLIRLLASVWVRKYAAVYSRAEDLFNLCQQSGFSPAELAPTIANMTMVFVESFRKKTFSLLARAYTSINLSLAQAYLGLPIDQILLAASTNGWSYDASTQVLAPPPRGSLRSEVASAPPTLQSFSVIADSVTRV
ncbi:uncharacterized protein LAESUDRAFT_695639 [Laetiporus sulphureus 93-53]|uniref:CSN8/PSMD8/EIF3K domain-containing protein n=1 Tax=Laetiporus sulphureus 93-53 TaxID=1314785 RepID=A0A165G3S3_9APHY|nr:uncharacterized protein LAESUDRAFT_695639 [Laetiporus sulphureus 93-53]KZT09788.1 hypothetical protein LAESUDRAFT_695639 [Laetiporus sulphureus 93-53]